MEQVNIATSIMLEDNSYTGTVRRNTAPILNSDKYIAVVFGATGRIGRIVTTNLISKGIKTIIVVKNKNKVIEVFEEHIFNRIQAIIQFDISKTSSEKGTETPITISDIFANIFSDEREYVIFNTMEIRHKHKENNGCLNIFQAHTNLYSELAKRKDQITKTVLLSSNYVNYPFLISSYCINLHHGWLLIFREQSEQILKKSGLNYLIIRAGKIESSKKVNFSTEKFFVSQNVLIKKAHIKDATVGKILIDSAFDKLVPDNSSFECWSTIGESSPQQNDTESADPEKSNLCKYVYEKGGLNLKADKDLKQGIFSQKVGYRLISTALFGILAGVTVLSYLGVKKMISQN